MASSQFCYEFFRGETGLLDDGYESPLWQGLAAMNRYADRPHRGAVVTQDVMAAANTVEFEPKSEQRANSLVSGYRRQVLRSHGQAAMVK